MYYARLIDGIPVRCNFSDVVPVGALPENPTEEQLSTYGIIIVNDALTLPEHDPDTHGLSEITPTQQDGKWYATYEVIEKAPVETPPTPQP
jgi:hypothetical protein